MKIYELCPVLENEKFLLTLVDDEDCNDLLKAYSDKIPSPQNLFIQRKPGKPGVTVLPGITIAKHRDKGKFL